jgi:hypothetical protein
MSADDFPLLPHQMAVVLLAHCPSLIVRGGYGSGKTIAGVAATIDRTKKNPVHVKSVVIEPTWKQVKKVLIPKFKKVLTAMGIGHRFHKTDNTFTLDCGRQIWLESGEIPENMSGFDAGFAWIDEPELMDPEVDDRVGSRVRDADAVVRQVLYTGTPEGITWIDDKVATGIPTITVATDENTRLPPDFLKRQLDKYRGDPVRLDMYFRGIPRTLAGQIYTCLNPSKHFRPCANIREGDIAICMDFNVDLMCTPIARVINHQAHIFSEVVSTNTRTEEHARRVVAHLKTLNLAQDGQRGGLVGPNGKRIEAWMDASSTAQKTSSTTTDHAIVNDVGFYSRHNRSNPAVKDRIEAVQYALSHDLLFVDPQGAPFTAKALQRHEYARGSHPPQPRKKWGDNDDPFDAATDSVGYLCFGISPLRARGARPM